MSEGSQGELAAILASGQNQLKLWDVHHDFSLKILLDEERVWHAYDCGNIDASKCQEEVIEPSAWVADANDLCVCVTPKLEKLFLILENAHEKVIISLAVSLRDGEEVPDLLIDKIVTLARLQRVYYESLRVIAWSGADNVKVNEDLAKPLQLKISNLRDIIMLPENEVELENLGINLAKKLYPDLNEYSSLELSKKVIYHLEEIRVKSFIDDNKEESLELEETDRYLLSFLKEWGSHVYAARYGFSPTLPYILTQSSRWLYELIKQKWEVSKFWDPLEPLVEEAVLLWSESDDLAPYASLDVALGAANKLFT